jgi:hypothetical protein
LREARALKTFTLEEANAALPEVRRAAGQIVELSHLIPELHDQERIHAYRAARANGDQASHDELELSRTALRDAELRLQRALGELEELGVALKDPQQGLIDFPSYREGELVELCWRVGEESVGHWHRIGEGFAGRQPV